METRNFIENALREMGEEFTELTINSESKIQEAMFVMTTIKYDAEWGPDGYNVPFIVYEDGGVFMPRDWQGWMPEIPEEIEEIEWVSCPDKELAILFNGLPRIFA